LLALGVIVADHAPSLVVADAVVTEPVFPLAPGAFGEMPVEHVAEATEARCLPHCDQLVAIIEIARRLGLPEA